MNTDTKEKQYTKEINDLKKMASIFDRRINELNSKIGALNAIIRRQENEIRVLLSKIRRG